MAEIRVAEFDQGWVATATDNLRVLSSGMQPSFREACLALLQEMQDKNPNNHKIMIKSKKSQHYTRTFL